MSTASKQKPGQHVLNPELKFNQIKPARGIEDRARSGRLGTDQPNPNHVANRQSNGLTPAHTSV
jgi:hypothetical protein